MPRLLSCGVEPADTDGPKPFISTASANGAKASFFSSAVEADLGWNVKNIMTHFAPSSRSRMGQIALPASGLVFPNSCTHSANEDFFADGQILFHINAPANKPEGDADW